jgi:GxxExxY protein
MSGHLPIGDEIDFVARGVVDAAFKVHSEMGAGLLESAYELCLAHELRKRGFVVRTQVTMPIVYDGVQIDAGYRVDLLVNECVIVEIKAVQEMHPVFKAQLLTHLKLARLRIGFLINFHVTMLKDGIKRFAL